MDQIQNKKYDLEDRTYKSLAVSLFCKQLPRTVSNTEYVKQVIRSSGSPAANYIEANEALSKKDFQMRIKFVERKRRKRLYG